MKKWLLLLLISSNAFAQYQIITDLDDTVKITRSHHIDSLFYGVFRTKVYAGMPHFVNASRDYVSSVHLVSASPKVLQSRVEALLNKHEIDYQSLTLNSNFKRPGHHDFKLGVIGKIIEASSEKVILLGDDMGADPEIFEILEGRYPGRIAASYIRIVKNREIPATVSTYFSAFDLALKEYEAGRFGLSNLHSVMQAVLNANEPEQVFPDFAYCPTNSEAYSWYDSTKLQKEAVIMKEYFLNICNNPR